MRRRTHDAARATVQRVIGEVETLVDVEVAIVVDFVAELWGAVEHGRILIGAVGPGATRTDPMSVTVLVEAIAADAGLGYADPQRIPGCADQLADGALGTRSILDTGRRTEVAVELLLAERPDASAVSVATAGPAVGI